MTWEYNDGGRDGSGFQGLAGDCVTRAIAIALELPYREVYDELAGRMAERGKPRSARRGIDRAVYERYLIERGWEWVPTMTIGSGCRVHLRAEELPAGRIIARLSKHVCAVLDGVVHDTHDPTREGTRCVYGYFRTPKGPEGPLARESFREGLDLSLHNPGPRRAPVEVPSEEGTP